MSNTEFSTDDLMNLPEGATFVDRKDKVITEVFPLFMILR
jgi:hypothetical protein